MKLEFSQKLIVKCQKIFGEKAGRKISAKEAEEFLDQLAMLGKLAVESFEEEKVENKKFKLKS